MTAPDGLWVDEHAGDDPLVVLVHGSMDRSASWARVLRKLRGRHVVRYDRRGYGRSRDAGQPADLHGHADDLLAVVDGRPAVLVGHSLGGAVVLTAAAREPSLVPAAVVFEAPLSWRSWWPADSAGGSALAGGGESSPADAAEAFLRRMIGDERWEGLPAKTRADRRAEGPALVAELVATRTGPAPYDPADLRLPVVVGRGSESSAHLRRAAEQLAGELPDAELVEIDGAGHGAHLSHAGAFAGLVDRALERLRG